MIGSYPLNEPAWEPAYEPQFINPYPEVYGSLGITNFRYLTPLHLQRSIEAVQCRVGEDAAYVVADTFRVGFRLDGRWMLVTVPRGMLTDLASVPRIARRIVNRVGPHLEAAIVHDFLYVAWQSLAGRGARPGDREFADKVFLAGMEAAGVAKWQRLAIYSAVRAFGGGVYYRRDPVRFTRLV